jgi:glutaredoxin
MPLDDCTIRSLSVDDHEHVGRKILSRSKNRVESGLGSGMMPVKRFLNMSESNPSLNIVAYLKPSCGWSQGVRAIMRKYQLPFEDRDIINDPVQRQEMIEKSGQMLSPCVEINGHMLADVSGEEVEAFMLANGLVAPSSVEPDAPINAPCPDEMPQAQRMQFGS